MSPAIVVQPVSQHPRHRELAAQIAECAAQESAAQSRIVEIERLLSKPEPEDPLAVLRDEPAQDAEGLRAEHLQLRSKVSRLQIAAATLRREQDVLVATVSPSMLVDAAAVHAALAAERVEALRALADIERRDRMLLDAVERAGHRLSGLQVLGDAHLDLETLIREAAREAFAAGSLAQRWATAKKAA